MVKIKKNSKDAKLIDEALMQLVNFLTMQTENRINQFNYQNNFSEVEAIAGEHLNMLTDIERLRKSLVDDPETLKLKKDSGFNSDDIPF